MKRLKKQSFLLQIFAFFCFCFEETKGGERRDESSSVSATGEVFVHTRHRIFKTIGQSAEVMRYANGNSRKSISFNPNNAMLSLENDQ